MYLLTWFLCRISLTKCPSASRWIDFSSLAWKITIELVDWQLNTCVKLLLDALIDDLYLECIQSLKFWFIIYYITITFHQEIKKIPETHLMINMGLSMATRMLTSISSENKKFNLPWSLCFRCLRVQHILINQMIWHLIINWYIPHN